MMTTIKIVSTDYRQPGENGTAISTLVSDLGPLGVDCIWVRPLLN